MFELNFVLAAGFMFLAYEKAPFKYLIFCLVFALNFVLAAGFMFLAYEKVPLNI